jgi:Fe2+ or Zn2+ uptake regulation protein
VLGSDAAQLDEQLGRRLRSRRLRVTSQRLVIHRAIRRVEQHLTAEQVLEAVADSLPGTSLPTIYATLELLEDLGLVRRVYAGSGAALFDSRTAPHAHAICRHCGAITDLATPVPPGPALAAARRAGFHGEYAQLVVWGACPACAARG